MGADFPAEVFPPGEFLRDEMEARGWSPADLARILGRPVREVKELLSASRPLTLEMAQSLGEALGADPEFWMNLEWTYRRFTSGVESGT